MNVSKLSPEFLKAAVYGANDGIITTFAVVAGVAGAGLSPKIIIILGIANMVADAVSMGVGDYLGEKSEQRLLAITKKNHKQSGLWKTGMVTFVSFVVAGSLPLSPFFLQMMGVPIASAWQFELSIVATMLTLFIVGSARTFITKGSWLRNGFEMLVLGTAAAAVAYGLGYGVSVLVG